MVSSTPRPHFTPGKDPLPNLQEAGWAPGPVWTGGKSRPHRDSIPDRPARRLVAIPTELPGPQFLMLYLIKLQSRVIQKLYSLPNIIVILSPIAYLKKFVRKIAKSTSNLISEADVKIQYILCT